MSLYNTRYFTFSPHLTTPDHCMVILRHVRKEHLHAEAAVLPERNAQMSGEVTCDLSHVSLQFGKCCKHIKQTGLIFDQYVNSWLYKSLLI